MAQGMSLEDLFGLTLRFIGVAFGLLFNELLGVLQFALRGGNQINEPIAVEIRLDGRIACMNP